MKNLVVLAGFSIVAVALYMALAKRAEPEPTGTLPQPAAPGLDHV